MAYRSAAAKLSCSASSRSSQSSWSRGAQLRLGLLGQGQEVARRGRPGPARSRPPRPAVRRRRPAPSPAAGTARRCSPVAVTSDLSTSEAITSITSPGRRRRPAPGGADLARPRPGWRRRGTPTGGAARPAPSSPSRSQLQSTMARSVWCRGSAVRLPVASSRNRSSSRLATWARVSDRSRAAASSMASGMPSSARQMRDDRRHGGFVHREPGPDRRGPVAEQPDGRVPGGLGGARAGRRQRQRRHRAQGLAGHAERLPAGGQDAHAGRVGQHPAGQPGHRVDQVLAVVQDQQQPLAGQRVGQPVQRRRGQGAAAVGHPAPPRGCRARPARPGSTSSASRTGASGTNQAPSGSSGAFSVAASRASRVLPAPPGPGQRDQPGVAEQLADPFQLLFPADEAGQLGGQVADAVTAVAGGGAAEGWSGEGFRLG